AVCLESELQEGQMMEVEVGHHSVLLTHCEGKFSAIGNQCTHYGAPLSKGKRGHTVRCPWHGACFNVHTGDLEEYPGIDSLPCHKVHKDKTFCCHGQLQEKRIKTMGAAVPGFTHTVVLLGGGAASLICAEVLRQQNFPGRIIMATRDDLLPYDKTRLSKVMNVETESILLRRMEFYLQYDIEVWLRKEAQSVNTDEKTVTFDDGSVQSYDQLLIATGCRAKGLNVPGINLDNFLTLLLLQMLTEKNVRFYMNDSVLEVRGQDGKVKEVVLKSAKVLPADVFIVGIGVKPNSEFLRGSRIQLDSRNFVVVDKYMRTNIPGVFCGGDVATFPLTMAKNQPVNIGHWQMAQAHGRIAALNMLDKPTELSSVPFYWTVLLGKTIRYAGYGEGYTEIVVKGKLEDKKFLALYIKNDAVIAAVSLNYDPAVSAVAQRLIAGKVITKEEAQSDELDWLQLS
uniref:Apoptosis inducing factor mitochondria associated 5 n=1 Tax=Takifugu rubripes TaxID=31033 RepID=H2U0H0_TAKRU